MKRHDQRRVLVTDDEASLRDNLGEYLSSLGYAVDTASDAASTLSSVADTDYNVVLLDHMLPDNTGLDVLRELLAKNPKLSVVMMTGYPTVDMIISAVRRGACDVVVKPFELKELSQAIGRAVARNQRLVDRSIDAEETAASEAAVGSDSDHCSRPRVLSRVDN